MHCAEAVLMTYDAYYLRRLRRAYEPITYGTPRCIWEYSYGWPAREACCPHKGQRGEYFAGPWQSSARLSAFALTAKT
eukprot:scaffold2086_cov133-Isochrysis_galbana.AAC.4